MKSKSRKWETLRESFERVDTNLKHILEFGVFEGVSTKIIRDSFDLSYSVFGFDTFTGLPEDWPGTKAKKGKAFNAGGLIPDIQDVTFYKGLFKDTIPEYLKVADRIGLIHIDCDLYSSTVDALYGVNDYIVPGTVMVFDEWTYAGHREDGEKKAFLEWAKDKNREFDILQTRVEVPSKFNSWDGYQALVLITK